MRHISRKTRFGILTGALFFLILTGTPNLWARPMRNRQRMMEKIETIKMWKLMDTLNLDSQTALKVFPIIKEMDQKKSDLMEKKRALMRQIRDQVNGKNTGEKLDALASQVFDITEKLCAVSREEYNKLKPILTEKQLGQYLLFQQRFRKELLRRWLLEKRGPQQNMRRGKKRGARPMMQPPQE